MSDYGEDLSEPDESGPAHARPIAPNSAEPAKPPPAVTAAEAPALPPEPAPPSYPPIENPLEPQVGPSDVPGVPADYHDGIGWLRSGLRRHTGAAALGLFMGWSAIWIAFWAALVGAVLGALTGLGASLHLAYFGGGVQASVAGVFAGAALGAAGTFILFFLIVFASAINAPLIFGAALVLTWLIVVITAAYERFSLRVRGYRRLSRDEVRRIAPLVQLNADAMNLPALPRFAMNDNPIANAYTHMRTVVLHTGLLDTLDDGELRAVLAHELHHWRMGDGVGLQFVWAASLPVAIVYNVGAAMRATGQGRIVALIGWLISWPADLIVRFFLVPATAHSQRRYEYQADAAAKEMGLGSALSAALKKMSAFEAGRTGWERAMAQTHPHTELRLEALQAEQPDDWDYQEEELKAPRWKEIRRLLLPFATPKPQLPTHTQSGRPISYVYEKPKRDTLGITIGLIVLAAGCFLFYWLYFH